MFSVIIGSRFEVSSQLGDFRLRIGRRGVYWSRDTGWISDRIA